jgi:hypothetical protein
MVTTFLGGLQALPAKIRLARYNWPGTNGLAYFNEKIEVL